MPIITTEEAEEFVVLPEGSVITVRVVEVKPRTVGEGTDNSWESLDFKFEITAVADARFSEAVGQNIWGGVAARLTDHADNKLRRWVKALLDFDAVAGFQLNTDTLVGRTARATVENYMKGQGANQVKRHKVGALLEQPTPGWQPGQPQVAPVQQAPPVQQTAFPAPAPWQPGQPVQNPYPAPPYVPPPTDDDVPF